MNRFALVLLLSVGGLLTGSWSARGQAFSVEFEDLGPFPAATVTDPRAINDRGDIVGYAYGPEGELAFLWTRKEGYQIIALNALPTDVNNRGDVVGLIDLCEYCAQHGFIWSRQHGLRNLGPFVPYAINERGTMVGLCTDNPSAYRPCVIEKGVLTELTGAGFPQGINARGDIVGVSPAFFWARGVLTELTEAGALELAPRDINDRGEIAGTRTYLGGPHGVTQKATIWTGEDVISPNVADNTLGLAINNRGLLVGFAWSAAPPFAFVWHPKAALQILDAPGAISSRAHDVNNRAEIVGPVWDSTGVSGTGLWRLRPGPGQ